MKKIILSALIGLSSQNSISAVTETGTVTNIIIEGSIASVWLTGFDEKSECTGGARWVLNETDSLFKEKYSSLLMALASGKEVTLKSTGVCAAMNGNSIYYVNVKS